MPNSRNYKREYQYEKKAFRRYHAKLNMQYANKLQALLDELGIGFTEWVKRHISKRGDD